MEIDFLVTLLVLLLLFLLTSTNDAVPVMSRHTADCSASRIVLSVFRFLVFNGLLLAILTVQVQIPSHRVSYLYDAYTCLAKNSHGSSNDTVHLIEARELMTLFGEHFMHKMLEMSPLV